MDHYLHLRDNKQPYSNQLFSKEQADLWSDGAGIMIPARVVLLDFDDETDFNKMLVILEATNLKDKARIVKTSRGGHVFFKSIDKRIRTQVAANLPILLSCDVKANLDGNAFVYEMVKQFGYWREVISDVSFETLIDLPEWLIPFSSKYLKTNRKDVILGTRNSKIYAHFNFLRTIISTSGAITACDLANDYVIDDPLTEDELSKALRVDESKDLEAIIKDTPSWVKLSQQKNGGVSYDFLWDKLADCLLEKYQSRRYQDRIYLFDFDNTEWTCNEYTIQNIIQEEVALFKNGMLSVKLTIKVIKDILSRMIASATLFVEKNHLIEYELENQTILSLRLINHKWEFRFLPLNEFNFTPFKLNASISQNQTNTLVDEMLAGMFNDNQIKMLWEMLGYTLIPSQAAKKFFWWYGTGNNGKSLLINALLAAVVGSQNLSAVGFGDLDKSTFGLQSLIGKYANVSSEASYITKAAIDTIKAVSGGDMITINRKNKTGLDVILRTKFFITSNEIPKITDQSLGWKERFQILVFDKTVGVELANDPYLIKKLDTKAVRDYALLKMLEGLFRLVENNYEFTKDEDPSHLELIQKFTNQKDAIDIYLEENMLNEKSFIFKECGKSCQMIFQEYYNLCKNQAVQAKYIVQYGNFVKKLMKKFNLIQEKSEVMINGLKNEMVVFIKR